jgi:hypothetical protein
MHHDPYSIRGNYGACCVSLPFMLQVPPRLDGFKVYEESDDEQLMLEVAAAWGSLAKVMCCC